LRIIRSHEHPDPRRRTRRRERRRKPGVRAQRHHGDRHRPAARARAAGPHGPARRGGQRHPAFGPAGSGRPGRGHADRLRPAGRDQPGHLQDRARRLRHPEDHRAGALARVRRRLAADGPHRLRGGPGDLPGSLADPLHPQADRVPRGAAGAGVRRRAGQPDRGARDLRRPAGAAHDLGAAEPGARRRDAHRLDLPARGRGAGPADRLRGFDAHRAGRRGVRAGRHPPHPHGAGIAAAPRAPGAAPDDRRRRAGRPAPGAPAAEGLPRQADRAGPAALRIPRLAAVGRHAGAARRLHRRGAAGRGERPGPWTCSSR